MNREPIYHCLIVDDEPFARDVLKRYIKRMPMLELSGECVNALEAAERMKHRSFDLVFLDVEMPQVSGLELLGTIRQPYKVILTTAFEQYALQAFDLDVRDYLLKPIRFERFYKAVSKALPGHGDLAEGAHQRQTSGSFLYFRCDRQMVKVLVADIKYIESQKDYVRISTDAGLVVTKYPIAALEAMLPQSSFLRTHRSFIVAVDRITAHNAECVLLGDHRIPVGRFYKPHVLHVLGH